MLSSSWPRLLILQIVTLCSVLIIGLGVAEAHVLKEDNGISAVLHIPPEDNPSAAQSTKLELAFGDANSAFNLPDCNCQVVVKSGQKTIQQVAIQPVSASDTLDGVAMVRFPAIGVYDVIVEGSAKKGSFNSFSLDYLIRVATSADDPSANQASGSDAVIIGAGSLVILGMVAYTAISRGGRYTKQTGRK